MLNSENELLGVAATAATYDGVVHLRGPLIDCNAIKWIYDVLKANPSTTTDLGDLHNVCWHEADCVVTMC